MNPVSYLLQLELDCGLGVLHFAHHGVGVQNGGRELACSVQTWAKNLGDLPNQCVGCQEGTVLLSCNTKQELINTNQLYTILTIYFIIFLLYNSPGYHSNDTDSMGFI